MLSTNGVVQKKRAEMIASKKKQLAEQAILDKISCLQIELEKLRG